MKNLLSIISILLIVASAHAQSYTDVSTPPGLRSQIIAHLNYTSSWNQDLKIPNWVAWTIDEDEHEKIVSRGDSQFSADPKARGTVSTMDYSRSGFDRGHMCPAADNRFSAQAMAESFYLSNVCPQNHTLNEKTWNNLESACRFWAGVGPVHIVCGPYFTGQARRRIGNNRVAVPDGFWKVILRFYKGRWQAIGFIFPNSDIQDSFMNYAVTVDKVEELTGFDFFLGLDDDVEYSVESSFDSKRWPYNQR